nr:TonB-dependent receptor [Bacteroidales bacterium]
MMWRKRIFLRVSCLCLFLMQALLLSAQKDSLQLELQDIEITEKFSIKEVRSASPLQRLDSKQLESMSALQLSDALKHFAGLSIKDYGGLGGMKTVSIRSLGTQHTGISYDGISLSDTQSGQIDISRFSLENVESLQLANGQSMNIFCTARQMAAAGLLEIQTKQPSFEAGRRHRAKLQFGAGSFGLLRPSFRWEHQLNERIAYSLDGEYLYSHGRYPYRLAYGAAAGDSIAHKIRQNNHISTGRIEGDLYIRPDRQSLWRSKIYYYQSERGLPNATTFYNDYQNAYLHDRQGFIQSNYSKDINESWAIKSAVKYQNSYQRYQDEGSLATHPSINEYWQQEYYGSFSTLYRCLENLSFAFNNDLAINHMEAEGIAHFAAPTRYSLLSALAGKYQNDFLSANASVLGSFIQEKTRQGQAAQHHIRFSPYAGLSIKPFQEECYLRGFFKHSFRLPSFNDLYYGKVGNVNLKPENAWQYNLGLTWARHISHWFPRFYISADAYYNRIEDKIVALPTKNLFVWSMTNLGRVDIKGIDVNLHGSLRPVKDYQIDFSGSYSFQQALDHTSQEGASGKVYGHQIAYTPRHSGSGQISLDTPFGQFSYNLTVCGERYILGQNIEENRLDGYSDHSLAYLKDFQWKHYQSRFKFEILNLLDENYAVIKYFPMPGRSIRASLSFSL